MSNPRPQTSQLLQPNQTQAGFVPPPINQVSETGLSQLWLQDLSLKILYFQGYMTGFKIAEAIALPFAGVTDQILDALKRGVCATDSPCFACTIIAARALYVHQTTIIHDQQAA